MDPEKGIPLFYPHIPNNAKKYVTEVLSTRWIGQGPKVDEFEAKFSEMIVKSGYNIAVNSGTSALHLAYILSGVTLGKEVICPLFTCTATNIPILYQKGKPVFVDIAVDSLNMDIQAIEKSITPQTVAISVVDYGGLPNDYKFLRDLCDCYGLKLIVDCAHALDTYFNSKHVTEFADYVIYSFQAIKTMTTGDGGMLVVKDSNDYEKAIRLRWFGINRSEKQQGVWENDVTELGYKYQMTDISAAIGLASLEEIKNVLSKRQMLYQIYHEKLEEFGGCLMERPTKSTRFTPWLATLNTNGKRVGLMNHLRVKNIESAQVHYRNDRYSIFKDYVKAPYLNMDKIEEDYLVLPFHTQLSVTDVQTICEEVKTYLRVH
jgi:dTDP-4-amino-4,6-dideoxygalactose transaminase